MSRLDAIITQLQNPDSGVQSAARTELRELASNGLTVEEGIAALNSAVLPFPPDKYMSIRSALVDAAAFSPDTAYVPVIIEQFPRYDEAAKASAQVLLMKLQEGEGAEGYVELVRRYAPTGDLTRLITRAYELNPIHSEVLFPSLLEHVVYPKLASEIYLLCVAHGNAGLLDERVLPHAPELAHQAHAIRENVLAYPQQPGIAWMWEDEAYFYLRRDFGIRLDVMGYFPASEVRQELRRSVMLNDPRLKTFAVISLLRIGEDVSPEQIAAAAASPETRSYLFEALQSIDALSLIPEQYRTQAALAEADMVGWLTYPAELGRPPDEIELMKVIEVETDTPGEMLDFYVFRFRTHESGEPQEWMAGVSGPFLRRDMPTTKSLGSTFSGFAAWESATPEEHLGDISDILAKWREYQSHR